MLRVKYIYNHKFFLRNDNTVGITKSPVACIVSEDNVVGISICCKGSYCRESDTFSKVRAREIAIGRMNVGSEKYIPNRKITNKFGDKVYLSDEINFWIDRMKAQTV